MAEAPHIVAYLKPVCGWSNSVRAAFAKYGLAYKDKDIINNPAIYAEMVQKSGQPPLALRRDQRPNVGRRRWRRGRGLDARKRSSRAGLGLTAHPAQHAPHALAQVGLLVVERPARRSANQRQRAP